MEWRQIADMNYEVNNLGQIRTKAGRILKPGIMANGYETVALSKDKKKKSYYVHRLVLIAFRGVSDLESDHINRIKTDNRLENLRWVTREENARNKDFKKQAVRNHNKCGYKNISFCERNNVFVAKIQRKGVYILNKQFKTIQEAIKCRDDFLQTFND